MRRILLTVVTILFAVGCGDRSPAPTVTVFAAASTTDVMREAGARFERSTGTVVTFSFDSSATLAKQIIAGSPADLFLSADERWMDSVAEAKAIRPESREDLLANDLVLVAPAGSSLQVSLAEGSSVEQLGSVRRLAIGEPTSVPAGRYANETLTSLGWREALGPRLLPTKDVRAALQLVERGEAEAGFVYATDARGSAAVVIVATAPETSHRPIRYPLAVTVGASERATAFAAFLRSDEMFEVFRAAGFRVIPSGGMAERGDGGDAGGGAP
jgi:molybdate transport system substrate-binding protein